jgi:hypothetical protein
MTGAFIGERRGKFETLTIRPWKMEAETGVMLPQTKECLEPPEEAQSTLFLASEGTWPCQQPDLGLLASRTMRE